VCSSTTSAATGSSTITVGDVRAFIDARRNTVSGLTIKHDPMPAARDPRRPFACYNTP
jgi:hypothetical protein